MNKNFFIKKLESEGYIKTQGKALDLGAGKGGDSLYLASLGYTVDAVDIKKDNTDFIQTSAVDLTGQITIHTADIINFVIEKDSYDIIIASNSLPFINSKEFVEAIIRNIYAGLKTGGIAYFSLFGQRDGWADKTDMSFFEYSEAEDILKNISAEIYFKSTEEGYGNTMKKDLKWWHIHRFYVRK